MVGTVTVAKLTRLAANCICPVVGAGVITATVPPVRHAVHHLTAPHEYALPKTRVRPVAVAPCAPAAAPALAALAPIAPAYDEAPLAAAAAPPGDIASLTPTTLPVYSTNPGVPTDIGYPPGGVLPVGPGSPTALPDGRTWIQLIVGFGLVGGAARMAHGKVRSA